MKELRQRCVEKTLGMGNVGVVEPLNKCSPSMIGNLYNAYRHRYIPRLLYRDLRYARLVFVSKISTLVRRIHACLFTEACC